MHTWSKLVVFLTAAAGAAALMGLCSQGRSFWERRGAIQVVAIDPTGRWIAAGGRYVGTQAYKSHGDVVISRVSDRAINHRFAAPSEVWNVAFDAKGQLLALTGPLTGKTSHLAVYALSADGLPKKVHEEVSELIPDAVFGFADRFLVLGGKGTLKVFDSSDWTHPQIMSYQDGVACDPASASLAVGVVTQDGPGIELVTLGDSKRRAVLTNERPFLFLPGHRLVTTKAGPGGGLMLWRDLNPAESSRLPEGDEQWVGGASSGDGQYMAAWTVDGSVKAWRLGLTGATLTARLPVERVNKVRFTADSDIIACAIEQKVTMTKDGSRAASVARGGVELWRLSQVRQLHAFEHGNNMAVHGALLASYLTGGEEVYLWDVANSSEPRLTWKERWRNPATPPIPSE